MYNLYAYWYVTDNTMSLVKFILNNNFPLVADGKKWTVDNIGNCEVQWRVIVEIIPTCKVIHIFKTKHICIIKLTQIRKNLDPETHR